MIYILDSAAILNNFEFYFEKTKHYLMTPQIAEEMRDMRSRLLLEQGISEGLLELREPSPESKEEIFEKAKELGLRLSDADISIIALAKDLNGKEEILVLSDDYAVQNLLSLLEIPFNSVLMDGIAETIAFIKKCSNCDKEFPPAYKGKTCDSCLGMLKKAKKPLKNPDN